MPEDASPNGDALSPGPAGSWTRVSEMQAKLHRWAVADPGRRFDDLFNFVYDPATLIVAFGRVAANHGANTPGVDGLTVACVEEVVGVPGFLDDLRAALKDGSFRPLPVRERKIPKPGGSGKLRKLGIPCIADRVVQAALKLVLEPIFEAGFPAGLLRVPAQAAATRRDRRDPPLRHPGLQVGAGRGRRGGLRQPLALLRHGPGAGASQGQARAGPGEGVPQSRGAHRTRRAPRDSHRHPARRRCDTRSHVYEWATSWRSVMLAEVWSQASARGPVLALTCVAGNGGVRSSGESRRLLVHPGEYGREEDRTGESREPSLMPRDCGLLPGGCWWQGFRAGRCEAAGAGRDIPFRPGGHHRPGVKKAPSPIGTHACGTWKPRRGPAVTAGRPTVREAEAPGGTGWPKKLMPVAERQQETGTTWLAPSLAVPDNWPDTGCCPDLKGC